MVIIISVVFCGIVLTPIFFFSDYLNQRLEYTYMFMLEFLLTLSFVVGDGVVEVD